MLLLNVIIVQYLDFQNPKDKKYLPYENNRCCLSKYNTNYVNSSSPDERYKTMTHYCEF